MPEGNPPSRFWYVLACALVVGAAIVAGLATFMSINAVALGRVELPGSVEFLVEEPGTWIIFAESTDGSPPSSHRLDIEFTSEGQESRPMLTDGVAISYSMGDRRGVGVGHVVLPRVGTWTLSGTLPEGEVDDGARSTFAYGPDPISAIFLPILIGGGLAVVLVSLGVGTFGLVFWMRFKANRATTVMEG